MKHNSQTETLIPDKQIWRVTIDIFGDISIIDIQIKRKSIKITSSIDIQI
jgi:hypothetical protein